MTLYTLILHIARYSYSCRLHSCHQQHQCMSALLNTSARDDRRRVIFPRVTDRTKRERQHVCRKNDSLHGHTRVFSQRGSHATRKPRCVDFIAALCPVLSMLYHGTTVWRTVHTYHEVAYITDWPLVNIEEPIVRPRGCIPAVQLSRTYAAVMALSCCRGSRMRVHACTLRLLRAGRPQYASTQVDVKRRYRNWRVSLPR